MWWLGVWFAFLAATMAVMMPTGVWTSQATSTPDSGVKEAATHSSCQSFQVPPTVAIVNGPAEGATLPDAGFVAGSGVALQPASSVPPARPTATTPVRLSISRRLIVL